MKGQVKTTQEHFIMHGAVKGKKFLMRVSSYCADWRETSATQVHLSVAWM